MVSEVRGMPGYAEVRRVEKWREGGDFAERSLNFLQYKVRGIRR